MGSVYFKSTVDFFFQNTMTGVDFYIKKIKNDSLPMVVGFIFLSFKLIFTENL